MSLLSHLAFATNKKSKIRKLLKLAPKTELHLHLGGSYPTEFLYSIAKSEQRAKLEAYLKKIQSYTLGDYHECFQVFPLVSKIVDTSDKVKLGTAAVCREMQRQNIIYVEIRSGLKDLGDGLEAYLLAMLEGIELAKKEFTAKILVSLRRDDKKEHIKRSVDLAIKYKKSGVIGLDISGDSTNGHYQNLVSDVKRARKFGLPVALHIGENSKEKHQVAELIAFKPSRIGHGVLLNERAVELIKEHKVPVEVCLSSSVMAKMLKDPLKHPWLVANHPICICTDDPLIFGSDLSNEFEIALKKLGEIDLNIVINGARKYAFDRISLTP